MRRIAFGLCLFVLAVFAVTVADAERSGRGGVEVSLDGRFSPRTLDRQRAGPVSITLEGTIAAPGRLQPPPLTSIEIAFGARGGLSTAGLPRCPLSRLRDATLWQALARCRRALVGHGSFLILARLAAGKPYRVRAGALAFNGGSESRPGVWIYASSGSLPTSFVLPFHLRRLRTGGFGISARAPVYQALGRWPRLRSFRLTLGRRYRAKGTWQSYLSASCPLPPRLHVGYFALARATYRFAPGPSITTTILRACRALDR